jgi:predicted ATPase
MYAQDPKAICLCRLAFIQWCLGYPDQAMQTSQEAVALAQAMGHPFSQAYVCASTALLHNHRRDVQTTLDWAEATIRLSSQHGLPFWLGIGAFLKGWVLSAQGKTETGIAQMYAGLATFRTTGSDFLRSYFSALLGVLEGELETAQSAFLCLLRRVGSRNPLRLKLALLTSGLLPEPRSQALQRVHDHAAFLWLLRIIFSRRQAQFF